jgi:hypothetical protein
MTTKKLYEELTDLEKLQKQWHKLSGLHTRDEWSAAIIRAATAAEIAANFAIRQEFSAKSKLDSMFIDNLLIWANGLSGKLNHLLVPLTIKEKKKSKKIKELKSLAEKVNAKRNAIVHRGEFCNEEEAKVLIKQASEFIIGLLQIYEPAFELNDEKR